MHIKAISLTETSPTCQEHSKQKVTIEPQYRKSATSMNERRRSTIKKLKTETETEAYIYIY